MINHQNINTYIIQDKKQGYMLYKKLYIGCKLFKNKYVKTDYKRKILVRLSIEKSYEIIKKNYRSPAAENIVEKCHELVSILFGRKSYFTLVVISDNTLFEADKRKMINVLLPCKL
jgi:hypothetical protein